MSNGSVGYRNPLSIPGRMLEGLSPTARADFESLLHACSYRSNVIIFTEGEPATGIYVVLEGEVRVSISSADGKHLNLRIARRRIQPNDLRRTPNVPRLSIGHPSANGRWN